MKQKKRGIFYTTAAIALTLVIIATYSAYSTYKLSDRMDVIGTRIETVNSFIKDVEKDIEKGAYIAGFRTLLSFNEFIAANGTFINGTINGYPMSLMQDSTFTDWANKISAESKKIDITFNFTINEIRLSQSDEWSVDIGLNLTLDIRDKRNTSSWIRDRYLTTRVDITGFEDPLYVINSKGRITNSIAKSNITQFVVNGDVTNLLAHTNH